MTMAARHVAVGRIRAAAGPTNHGRSSAPAIASIDTEATLGRPAAANTADGAARHFTAP
jgi:hypothetical protein